jgi:predicted amidophosphoribosyltransferase
MSSWGGALLDFLFPPVCVGCGLFGTNWCAQCDIARLSSGPFFSTIKNVEIISAHSFDCTAVRGAIHALKYTSIISMGAMMGQWMYEAVSGTDFFAYPIILLPIPLTQKRFALRGFNQTTLLAQGIAAAAARAGVTVSVDDTILTRKHGSGQQAHRSRKERIGAMTGAFFAQNIDKIAYYCIVDDVLTTGSTVTAAIHALQNAGGQNIHAITLARA